MPEITAFVLQLTIRDVIVIFFETYGPKIGVQNHTLTAQNTKNRTLEIGILQNFSTLIHSTF